MRYFILVLSLGLLISSGCDENNQLENLLIYDDGTTQIYLDDVLEYRCPIDLECLWEGNAEVTMFLITSGGSATFTLNTHGNYVQSENILGIQVELVALDPYPVNSDPIPELEDYIVTLNVF